MHHRVTEENFLSYSRKSARAVTTNPLRFLNGRYSRLSLKFPIWANVKAFGDRLSQKRAVLGQYNPLLR